MKLSEWMLTKHWLDTDKLPYIKEVIAIWATKVAQLEAEIALKADYIKRLEAENAVLIKRLWDYEHQASDERIRDEK